MMGAVANSNVPLRVFLNNASRKRLGGKFMIVDASAVSFSCTKVPAMTR
jgi:hypothetical protein